MRIGVSSDFGMETWFSSTMGRLKLTGSPLVFIKSGSLTTVDVVLDFIVPRADCFESNAVRNIKGVVELRVGDFANNFAMTYS
jgi:hypothetical protein